MGDGRRKSLEIGKICAALRAAELFDNRASGGMADGTGMSILDVEIWIQFLKNRQTYQTSKRRAAQFAVKRGAQQLHTISSQLHW